MIIISVPNENDSVCKITLSNRIYHLRFTWNDASKIWSFGIYDDMMNPIVPMTRIVVQIPLLHYYTYSGLPDGDFMAVKLSGDDIGREDFASGNAAFAFIPSEEWTV